MVFLRRRRLVESLRSPSESEPLRKQKLDEQTLRTIELLEDSLGEWKAVEVLVQPRQPVRLPRGKPKELRLATVKLLDRRKSKLGPTESQFFMLTKHKALMQGLE